MLEYLCGLDFHIDQLFWAQELPGKSQPFPGRMSPLAAIDLTLFAPGLWLLTRKRRATIAQMLALAIFAIALAGFVGYFYGARPLYAMGHATAMAINSSAAFILLSVGLLSLSPRKGLVGLLLDPGLSGSVARRFVPAAICIPFILGWLRLWGQHRLLFDTETGVSVFCLSSIAAFLAFIWWNSLYIFRADSALRESSLRYNFLTKALPQIIWTANADGTVSYFNESWHQYTGLSFEETKDHSWKIVIHPEDLPGCLERWNRALATGEVYETEYRLRSASGTYRWHLGRALPLRNSDGQITEWVGTCTDIHGQKHAARELERWVEIRTEELSNMNAHLRSSELKFRSVTQSVPEAIISSNAKGNIIFWNAAAEKIFGYTESQALGKSLVMIVPERNQRGFYTGLKGLRSAPRARTYGRRLEVLGLHRDGHEFPIDVAVSRSGEKGAEFLTGIIRDITRQKADERELQLAKDTAETANRAKSEFLANMSHEIRTPLNGIIGMTELALDERLPETVRGQLELVKTSGQSLLKLLNEVLDFSKLEAQKLVLESVPFDLGDCLAATLGPMHLRAKKKGLTLVPELATGLPRAVAGDPTRLGQILNNLIDNAIKFTSRGQVRVAVKLVKVEGGLIQLLFSITDSGIGIPKDKQGLIFEAFAQADGSTTRNFGGTGLGLGICARLVEMMGGRIWVESEPGEGSTFRFTARFGAASMAALAPPKSDALEQLTVPSCRVLLAEDNPVNRLVATGMLQQEGHTVTMAEDGKEALAQLAASHFDLVLMDVQMPVMDGLAATREIRAREIETGKHLPIIAMTAHAQKEDEKRCLAAGMDAYISKPITKMALLGAISRTWQRLGASQVDARIANSVATRSMLLDQTDGDPALLRELEEVFRASTPSVLKDIRASIAARDARMLARSAHSLLSSFGVFGAARATELTKNLEKAGETADFSSAPQQLDELEREADRIFTALANH